MLTNALPPGMEIGLFTNVMVFVTPPTTVVITWACCATVTVPDLCTVMMGRVGVLVVDEETEVPTWAAAVFSMRVAGLLTCLLKISIKKRASYKSLWRQYEFSHLLIITDRT